VHRGAEVRIALGDVDDAKLARPGEDILEELAVDGLEMGRVELALHAAIFKFQAASCRERTFTHLQLCVIENAEDVARARIVSL